MKIIFIKFIRKYIQWLMIININRILIRWGFISWIGCSLRRRWCRWNRVYNWVILFLSYRLYLIGSSSHGCVSLRMTLRYVIRVLGGIECLGWRLNSRLRGFDHLVGLFKYFNYEEWHQWNEAWIQVGSYWSLIELWLFENQQTMTIYYSTTIWRYLSSYQTCIF